MGTKKNSKGYRDAWVGYKLHIDVADGQTREHSRALGHVPLIDINPRRQLHSVRAHNLLKRECPLP